MKLSAIIRPLISLTLMSVLMTNAAQAADALQMQLQANKVVKLADGKVAYTPVSTAASGTVIQYKATYTNTIDKAINNVTVTLPIPNSMTFTGEAFPASAQATIDGKNYADMPLMRKVNGKMVKVPYSEYKALRWNIKLLPAKKTADVALNATVD